MHKMMTRSKMTETYRDDLKVLTKFTRRRNTIKDVNICWNCGRKNVVLNIGKKRARELGYTKGFYRDDRIFCQNCNNKFINLHEHLTMKLSGLLKVL